MNRLPFTKLAAKALEEGKDLIFSLTGIDEVMHCGNLRRAMPE